MLPAHLIDDVVAAKKLADWHSSTLDQLTMAEFIATAPAQSESIGLFGTITVDIDAELAQLGPTGHRPPALRQPQVTAGVT